MRRRGIRVIPSSGRAQASMELHMRQLDTGLPYIACNGAQIVNADHTMMEELVLPAALARELCAFWEGEGIYVQAYRGDVFYYKEGVASRGYKRSSGMTGVEVGTWRIFSPLTPQAPGRGRAGGHRPAVPALRERYERLVFTISKPYFAKPFLPEAN